MELGHNIETFQKSSTCVERNLPTKEKICPLLFRYLHVSLYCVFRLRSKDVFNINDLFCTGKHYELIPGLSTQLYDVRKSTHYVSLQSIKQFSLYIKG